MLFSIINDIEIWDAFYYNWHLKGEKKEEVLFSSMDVVFRRRRTSLFVGEDNIVIEAYTIFANESLFRLLSRINAIETELHVIYVLKKQYFKKKKDRTNPTNTCRLMIFCKLLFVYNWQIVPVTIYTAIDMSLSIYQQY